MVKKWSEIAGSEEFAALPDTDKDVVRQAYFERVVAPDVAPDQLEATRDRFNDASGYRKRALPAGVKPSLAGAGRGSVNPDGPPPEPPPPKPTRDVPALDVLGNQTGGSEQIELPPEPIEPGGSILDRPAGVKRPQTMSEAEYRTNYGANKREPPPVPYRPGTDTIKPVEPETALGQTIRQATGKSGGAAAVQGAVQGLGELGAVVPGLVAGAADVVGAEEVSKFALGAAQRAKNFGAAVEPQGGYYEKLIGNVFNSSVQSLPTMAFGAGGAAEVVGGKVVADAAAKQAASNAMRALFVQTAGQEYADARNRGFDPTESAARAGIFGAAEVLGERFGFHEQMAVLRATLGKKKLNGDQLARTLATEVFKEIPGEELTTAIEFLADKVGPAAKSPKATLADYLEQAADTAIQTVGQTALMGAPAAVRGTYDRANAAMAYDQAARAGLNVAPPYATDTPDVQRKKTIGIFSAIAAQYGIQSDAVKRATEAANEMPVENVGPFLARMATALQKRGLVAKPVDEVATDVLTAGLADDPKVLEKAAKEAEKAADEGKTSQKPATVGDTNTPASRETSTAEEDLTGLSEPSRAPAARTESVIDQAATEGATHPSNDLPEPTEAQKHAENYKVGHDNETIPGERLSIENGAGSTRRGVSPEGKPWETKMQDHYGRILGTVGMDSTPEKPQHVDFFAKAGTPPSHTGPVFIVDQVDPKTGKPDEHKVMFGYGSLKEARKAYLAHYEKGWKGLGAITETSLDEFKAWVHSDATSKPFAPPGPVSEHRVIARVGTMPTNALPLELRGDGKTLTAWHAGHEVLNFESGEPVTVPASSSDAEALQIVKDSGAFGRRSKYFNVGESHATDQVEQQPSASAEHQDGDRGRETAEAGGGDRVQRAEGGGEAPAAQPAAPAEEVASKPEGKPEVSDLPGFEPGDTLARFGPRGLKGNAWVLREKATGKSVLETSDPAKVRALNTEKYEAVPIGQHLAEINDRTSLAARAAGQPPAPPKIRKLSEKEAFANDYAAFDGRDVVQSVQISDTGEEAQLRIPASRAMRALDARLKALQELRGCISRHA